MSDPIVPAYTYTFHFSGTGLMRRGRLTKALVFCPYCKGAHSHSPSPGERLSHCGNRHAGGSYVLALRGPATPQQVRKWKRLRKAMREGPE